MPSVSIEQNLESRQTYLRLRGVGHLLRKPQFGISGDSNEMLGPDGWKNQDVINGSRQVLDGVDLLLEVDSRLVAYIEPGRAIEIRVDELNFSERISPPSLLAFPSSRAPRPPGAKFYDFESSAGGGFDAPDPNRSRSRPSADADQTRAPHEAERFGPDMDELTRDISRDEGGDGEGHDRTRLAEDQEDDRHGHEADGDHTRLASEDEVPEPVEDDGATPPPIPEQEETKAGPDDEAESSPGYHWRSLAAVLVVGLLVGFFTKYIVDEYFPGSAQGGAGSNRRIAMLQTDAFGPLSEDLKQIPEKSPLGLTEPPDVKPLTVNRARSYYNYGAGKVRENKAEGVYWYKRSVQMVEVEALSFLGDGYMYGEGVPRDLRTGYQLLRLAAALGSDTARRSLDTLLAANKVPGAPPTMAEAFRLR